MKKVPILCGKVGDFHQARWYSLDTWIPTREQIDLFSSNILSSLLAMHINLMGVLPRWLSGKISACQCRSSRRCEIDPWLRNFPWRKKWQLTPVLLPGKFHGHRSLAVYGPWVTKSDRMQWIINHIPKQGTFSKCLIQVHMLYWGMYIYTMQNMN